MPKTLIIVGMLLAEALLGAVPAVVSTSMKGYTVRNGLLYQQDATEPFSGTVAITKYGDKVEIRKYLEGKRHGIWQLVTQKGVVVEEIDYQGNAVNGASTMRRMKALMAHNAERYADQPEIVAYTIYRVGRRSYYEQQYKEALGYFEKTLAQLTSRGSLYSDTLIYIGRSQYHLGDYRSSEHHLKQAVTAVESRKGKDSLSLVYPLTKLANLYRNAGDTRSMIVTLARVRSLYTKANMANSISALRNRLDLSSAWRRQGNRRSAMEIALNVYQELEKHHEAPASIRAMTCRRLSQALMDMGRFKDALKYSKEELEIRGHLAPEENYGVHFVHRMLGKIYTALENPEEAVRHHQAGLEYHQKYFGSDKAWAFEGAALLAEAHMELNDMPAAAAALKALEKEALSGDDNRLERLHYCIAQWQMTHRLKQNAEARRWARRIKFLYEAQIKEIVRYGSERQRWSSWAINPGHSYLANSGDAEGLAEHLLRTKGWVIASAKMDLLAASLSPDPKVQALLEQRRAVNSEIEALSREGRLQHRRRLLNLETQSVKSRFHLSKQIDEMDKLIHSIARQMPNWVDPLEATVPALRQAIAGDAVLLEYIRYHRQTAEGKTKSAFGCLVVTRDHPVRWVPLNAAADIETLLEDAEVKNPRTDKVYEKQMNTLWKQLIQPTQAHWPKETRSLVISADHVLNVQSFAILLDSNNRFLGEQYSIAYLHASSDLLMPGVQPQNRMVEIFADPVFEAPRNNGKEFQILASMRRDDAGKFHSLPESRAEAVTIEAMAKKVGRSTRLHLGEAADEFGLHGVKSPSVLHIATHGIGAEMQGSASMRGYAAQILGSRRSHGLAMAGAQRTVDDWQVGEGAAAHRDGIVSADELSNLRLANTQLVVLSACASGRGYATKGQGVLGMRRALALAGARNVMMTHWEVSDKWTSQFMIDYYRAYLKSNEPVAALQQVQGQWLRKLRESEGTKIAAQIAGPFFITIQGGR